jgi:hypothetical protein
MADNPTDPVDRLEADADLRSPLARVSYVEGMLLGLEATRDEQDFHRRRLSRHQFWLHGRGTIAGMNVTLGYDAADPNLADDTKNMAVDLVVSPGVGIDGLGREVTADTRYGMRVNEWLEAQRRDDLVTSFRDNVLSLKVTARYEPVGRGMQPVLARKLNAGTDAVDFSRIGDSCMLELLPDPDARPGLEASDDGLASWQRRVPSDAAVDALLSDREKQFVGDAAGDAPRLRTLRLFARLLHAFDGGDLPLTDLSEGRERLLALARIPLASVQLELVDLDHLTVHPKRLKVNNLARPFAVPVNLAALLAASL